MGSYCSLPKTERILIGDLTFLPDVEQKLYQLSHYVLNQKDPFVGTVLPLLRMKIIEIETSQTDSETKEKNVDILNKNASCSEKSLQKAASSDTLDPQHVCNNIDINEHTDIESLFFLLITNKPYYFSQTFSQYRTFLRYSMLCPLVCCRTEKRKVYLQPMDSFPDFITNFEVEMKSYGCTFDFFGLLKTFTEIYFDGMDVSLLPVRNNVQRKWKITTRLHHKTGQKQYFVRDFYNALQRVKPSDGYCIMGISWTDLYPTKDLNFVLGEANFATKSGIFCFGRYEPKSYDPDSHEDITEVTATVLWRILKVLSHETCHLFGLQHCWYFQCAMNESCSMKEAASQPLFLCPVCLRKLQYPCGFSVLQRYQKMMRFMTDLCLIYPTKEFKHCVMWLEKCLQFLEND